MHGPLSSESAVYRRDRGLRATVSSWQKSAETMWESVVLSGFPTAGNRLFHVASAPKKTLVLWLQMGREANCRCHGMTSRRSFSSHVQSFPPPPGPAVPL